MAYLTVSDIPAGTPSTLTQPLTGRPWADVTLAERATPLRPGDGVQVALQGGDTYQMTVQYVGPRGGFSSAYLVGGTGGLSRDIAPKYYAKIPARTVLEELLQDCGEVAGTIDLPGTLAAWVRAAGPAHEALRALMMRSPERVWRMRPGGQVDVQVPSWPAHDAPLAILHEDAAAGSYTVGLTPDLRVGTLVTLTRGSETLSKRVTRVTHALALQHDYPQGQTLRTHLGTGDGEDRGVSGLEANVQRAMRWTDYLALYDCEVLRDHGDHTLDLRPSNPQLPELTRVRLVQPLPGTRVKLKAGGTVLLSFQAGDPARPVVLHYGSATLERLEIATGRGQLLRLDDDRGEVSPEDQLYVRPHIRLQDASGQSVEMWAEKGKERIRVLDKAGQEVLMDAKPGSERVRVTDKAGQKIDLNAAAQTLTIRGQGALNIVSSGPVMLAGPTISLNGGSPVARVGDAVSGTTSTGVPFAGTITTGSATVRSG
jgi:uncharacterized Zn-binding protein involved in type VI secretion